MRRLACALYAAVVAFSVLGCGGGTTIESVPDAERKPLSAEDMNKMKGATGGAPVKAPR